MWLEVCLGVVWSDVGCWEEASPGAELSCPPMLVTPVRHCDHISSSELQLAVLLRLEVVEGLDQELLRHHLLEFDVLTPGHTGAVVVVHQLVEAVELHHPKEEFTLSISENFEMLDTITTLDTEGKVSRRALAHPHYKSSLMFVHQQFLSSSSRDPAIVPGVRLHLDIIGRYQAFPPIQLRPVPVHVILLVEDLEYLMFSKAELIICCGVEVVFGDCFHCTDLGCLFHNVELFTITVCLLRPNPQSPLIHLVCAMSHHA